MTEATPARPRKRRRLQRDKDFTGARLTTFRQVFLRHGLLGLVLAALFLAWPGFQSLFAESLTRASTHPARYILGFGLILIGLNAYAWRIDRSWSVAKLGWILYLGALSVWEEWVFRLALPQALESLGLTVWPAIIVSAIVFGALHYFTLRWRWQWCVSAAFGGLYFSHQMELHGDLLWVAGIHWVATYVNTPRLPGHNSGQVPEAK